MSSWCQSQQPTSWFSTYTNQSERSVSIHAIWVIPQKNKIKQETMKWPTLANEPPPSFFSSLLFCSSTDTGSGEADVAVGDAGRGGEDFLFFINRCGESDAGLSGWTPFKSVWLLPWRRRSAGDFIHWLFEWVFVNRLLIKLRVKNPELTQSPEEL